MASYLYHYFFLQNYCGLATVLDLFWFLHFWNFSNDNWVPWSGSQSQSEIHFMILIAPPKLYGDDCELGIISFLSATMDRRSSHLVVDRHAQKTWQLIVSKIATMKWFTKKLKSHFKRIWNKLFPRRVQNLNLFKTLFGLVTTEIKQKL